MVTERRRALTVAAVLLVIAGAVAAYALWPKVQVARNLQRSGGDRVYNVPGESMRPTLEIGDQISTSTTKPFHLVRGDLVVTPVQGTALVKRVIALGPADVAFADGGVLVDGTRIAEPYLAPGTITTPYGFDAGNCTPAAPCHVPEGMFWAMGDNRTNSKDSRSFGPLRVDDVEAVVLSVISPPDHARTFGPGGS